MLLLGEQDVYRSTGFKQTDMWHVSKWYRQTQSCNSSENIHTEEKVNWWRNFITDWYVFQFMYKCNFHGVTLW